MNAPAMSTVMVTVVSLLLGCDSAESNDVADSAEGVGPWVSPGAVSADSIFYHAIDAGTETELGFSMSEAAAAFSGTYVTTLRYADGRSSTLTLAVEPNGEPVRASQVEGSPLDYVYDTNGGPGGSSLVSTSSSYRRTVGSTKSFRRGFRLAI